MAFQLNDDILVNVLEHAYYDNDGQPDRATLRNATAVSRQWADCAQPFLWTILNVMDAPVNITSNLPSLLSHTPSLADCVHVLSLTHGGGQPFEDLIPRLPRLYELRIKSIELNLAGELPMLPTVRSLVLHSWPTMSRVPFDIMLRTPNLRFLRLNSELASRVPATGSPAFRLYELALHRVPRDNQLEWLLPTLESSLEILETYDVPSSILASLIRVRGPYLRSLRINVHNFLVSHALRSCTVLEEYKMSMVPKISDLTKLPSTIQYLAFGNWAGDPLHLIIQGVQSLPNLRTVTHDTNSMGRPEFAELQELCRNRGIELRHEVFPVWNCEDAVEVDHFPRTKSLANLRVARRSLHSAPTLPTHGLVAASA